MFKVGDKVVYQVHGIGEIVSVEERVIADKKEDYYIVEIEETKIKVMVPVNNAKEVGLRRLLDDCGLKEIFKVLNEECDSLPTNWNRRYKYNLEKIKTGSIYQIAEVFRDLTSLSKERDLSFGEKKMLDDIRRVIIAEIANAKNVLSDSAETILDEQVRMALQ